MGAFLSLPGAKHLLDSQPDGTILVFADGNGLSIMIKTWEGWEQYKRNASPDILYASYAVAEWIVPNFEDGYEPSDWSLS